MTKCNRILLCAMLAVVMTLACALTILPVAHPTTANAAGETYTKVTAEQADWSGRYILLYEEINSNNVVESGLAWTGVDEGQCRVSVSITNSKVIWDNQGNQPATLTLTKQNDGGYFVQVNGGTNDGKYISGTSKITFLDKGTSLEVSYDADSKCSLIKQSGVVDAGKKATYLRYNANTGETNERFRFYKTTQKNVQLYKLDTATPEPPVSNSALTLTETVSAVADSSEIKSIDGTNTLVLGAGGMFDVVYAIESATDIWAIEATAIAGKIGDTDNTYLSVKNITAGSEVAAEANVSGETATTLKIASTGDMSKYVGKQLVTVRYQLNEGVTEVPTGAFGLEVKAVGKDAEYVAANKVTTTANATPIKVVQTANITLKNNTVDYKATRITVGTENADIIVDNGGHTGAMTATWVDGEGNALADQNVVNAGAYKLKLAFAANGIYAAQEQTFDVTVNKATLTVVSISAKNGNARKPIKNGSASWTTADFGVTVSGLLGDDKLEGTMVITAPTAPEALTLNTAGTLDVSLKYTLTSANYKFATADNVTENTVTGTVTVEAYSKGIKIEGKPSVDGDYYYDTGIDFSTLYVYDITDESKTRLENVTFKITIRQDGMEDIVVEGEQAKTYVLRNAGTYIITIEASATIDNDTYTDISENNEYTINKLNLTNIVLDYKTDGKVTWSAPKYYTTDPADAKDLNTLTGVTANITYKVNDGEPFAATEYAPTATADSLTIAVLCDNANFNLPKAVVTKAVVSVAFSDEKNPETTLATQYLFVGQHATAPTAPEHGGWTFEGWCLNGETTTFDFATVAVNESITLVAKWTENINKVTLTIKYLYNGSVVDTKAVTEIDGYTKLDGITMPEAVKVAWLSLEGYYTDEGCATKFEQMPNADLTIYAKYVLALGNGDIDGDGTVGNNDIMLYRMYIVGGYDIEVIEIGGEYEAAKNYNGTDKLFFKAVANVNGDKTTEGEIQTDVYDIRDAAVLAMAMVDANGYGVSEDNTHITTPSDSTNASASTSTQAVQYALLPTGKYAA